LGKDNIASTFEGGTVFKNSGKSHVTFGVKKWYTPMAKPKIHENIRGFFNFG